MQTSDNVDVIITQCIFLLWSIVAHWDLRYLRGNEECSLWMDPLYMQYQLHPFVKAPHLFPFQDANSLQSFHSHTGADLGLENRGGAGGVISVLA